MARLLPFRQSDTPHKPRHPRLVELDDEAADAVFAALSTETARSILGRLYDEPGTATDVAEAADTSLQNARYHLDKLQAADLVEPVDTWYSSRGTEMTVYAPTNEPLVVAAGPDEQTSVLRSALGRLVGGLAVLGLASLLIDRLARLGPAGLLPFGQTGGADGGDSVGVELESDSATFHAAEAANATATPTATPEATGTPEIAETAVQEATTTPSPTPAPTPTPATETGLVDLVGGLPPGALFFLGGLVVLVGVASWWYWRRYRPLYG